MIYFKKVHLDSPNKDQVEKAIRKITLKRNSLLDFTSSGMITGTDKCFLGLEGKNYTKFTRIRYSVENLLPKLIMSIPKESGKSFYKIRLSFKSFVLFCFGAIMTLITFVLSFIYPNGIGTFAIMAIFYIALILLILLEIKLTQKAINSAVYKYLQTTI